MQDIGANTVQSVLKLIEKNQPNNIDELCIWNSKIGHDVVNMLLKGLNEKSNLKTLSFNSVNLSNDENFE